MSGCPYVFVKCLGWFVGEFCGGGFGRGCFVGQRVLTDLGLLFGVGVMRLGVVVGFLGRILYF